MPLIIGLLAVNAIMHGMVVARFGVGNHNQPFLVFAVVYAALAVAGYLAVPHVLWAVLVLSTLGIVGLSVTFNRPVRDKTLDKLIWVLDAVTISCAAYRLFAA
jgi:hypothetical protein